LPRPSFVLILGLLLAARRRPGHARDRDGERGQGAGRERAAAIAASAAAAAAALVVQRGLDGGKGGLGDLEGQARLAAEQLQQGAHVVARVAGAARQAGAGAPGQIGRAAAERRRVGVGVGGLRRRRRCRPPDRGGRGRGNRSGGRRTAPVLSIVLRAVLDDQDRHLRARH